MNRAVKKYNNSNRNLYPRKPTVQDIQTKNPTKKPPAQKLVLKHDRGKTTSLRTTQVKTEQTDTQQILPYVRKANLKRDSYKFNDWTKEPKGFSHCEISQSNFSSNQQKKKYAKLNESPSCIEMVRKSLQESQKTVPVQNSNSTAETNHLIKQIIAKSRSRRQLNSRIPSELSNYTSTLNRMYSQQREQSSDSKSQDQAKILLGQLETNKNIRSCKQIHLFRINSKKNLVIDRSDEPRKLSVDRLDNFNEEKRKTQKAYLSVRQDIVSSIMNSSKNARLEIKENYNTINSHPNLEQSSVLQVPNQISEIREIQFSQKNSQIDKEIEIPQIDCSIICQKDETANKSSFMNETTRKIFNRIESEKNANVLNYQSHSNAYKASMGGLPPGQLKKLFEQKNRKKILEVQKLRKKFPTDFFKV